MSADVLASLLAAACPALLLVLCFQRASGQVRWPSRGWPSLSLSAALAAGVLLLPIGGLVMARWVAAFSANFSIPLTGLLAVTVWERGFSRQIFSRRDWAAGWAFGAIGGLTLYPLALGIGSVDPYEWGWRFSPLFVVIGAVTAWLIWKQNRFGFLLLLTAGAFHLQLLESTNYWDYLLDPVFCAASLVALGRRLARRSVIAPAPVPSQRSTPASTSSSLTNRLSKTFPRSMSRIWSGVCRVAMSSRSPSTVPPPTSVRSIGSRIAKSG